LAKIQVKTYLKQYMTKRKGNYQCRTYYVYLPKRVAEKFIGTNLRITCSNSGILIHPVTN